MQRLTIPLMLLAFSIACSKAPPAQQQVASKQSPAEESAESPSVDPPPAPVVVEEVESSEPVVDESPARLAVGDQAPNFSLKDQDGTDRNLQALLADGQVAIVFHRSADW